MSDKISHLKKLMSEASGKIMESSAANISAWLGENFLPEWAVDALVELFEEGRYEEIDDRFFRFLAFGTGGMRGRTIGKSPAMAELGRQSEQGTPEHAAVGANNMNDFNVVRATMGLFNYCKSHLGAAGGVPKLAVAYDVRHFSKRFGELAASVWARMGGEAYIFDSPRSTPQLSFTVRPPENHGGDCHNGVPQPAPRQRLQGLFLRRRAGDKPPRGGHCRRGRKSGVERRRQVSRNRLVGR